MHKGLWRHILLHFPYWGNEAKCNIMNHCALCADMELLLPSSEEDVLESLFESLESDRVLDVFDALEPFLVTFEF